MRIVISEFISLDGVVQAPGGAEEDTDGGFRHGGWSMPFFDPEVMGSATLSRALFAADLVDEVLLMIEPIILGGGKRAFPDDGEARRFDLLSAKTTATGVQVCHYQRAA